MIESNEGTPVSPEVARHILLAKREELDPSDGGICGITFFDTEALGRMARTGRLVHRSPYVATLANNVVPVIPTAGMQDALDVSRLSKDMRGLFDEPKQASIRAAINAENTAKTLYFIRRLRLPFSNPALTQVVLDYLVDDPETFDSTVLHPYENPGLEESADRMNTALDLLPFIPSDKIPLVSAVADEARKRRGFVTGIRTGSNFGIHYTDGHVMLSFETNGAGIPHDVFAPIVPKGDYEKKFLNEMEKYT